MFARAFFCLWQIVVLLKLSVLLFLLMCDTSHYHNNHKQRTAQIAREQSRQSGMRLRIGISISVRPTQQDDAADKVDYAPQYIHKGRRVTTNKSNSEVRHTVW